jgi:threonine dehydratase
MSEHVVALDRILAARETVDRHVHRTPVLASTAAWQGAERVARESGAAVPGGSRIWVKGEHLQKTGSFKARGMSSKVAALPASVRDRGIITLSAGNAGQAYAWAGRRAGVRTVVVMPLEAVPSKVAACRGYGAEVVLHGTHVGEAFAEMERLRDEMDLTFAHPFDDPDVIAGHGSVGLEILEDLPDVDVVVVPVGGGGLISGVAAAVKETRPGVRVYGVEPEGSNAMSLALEAGAPVRIDPQSVADGLGAPFAGTWTLAMCRRYLDGIVLLDDARILAGLVFAAERMKQVLEPAGAAALAAVLAGTVPLREGDRVCVVASGGNVDTARLGTFISGAARSALASGAPGGLAG